ncbi:peroxiredoxin-like family protein [Flavobacterium laiguense]|uniref:thioredoxin-dependent peroxiredoxin n=1 Tax=Flavobacterium laiguense TaxID=2169409 RepID=A0A2U1JNH9_9FLAO|nr:peroxiredoxin-like family protein [Flavobacterium laiguense]PWA06731.1 antioxidant AhpC [Flavobacterium laiguense]
MKKMICIAMLTFGFNVFAQSEIPKLPTEVCPLLISEKIPAASLKSVDGLTVDLAKMIASKKTILVFYRGGWCPYCNMHLAALNDAEKELLSLGYQIIAVSPDSPKSLKAIDDKDKINYTLLSDSDGALSKAVGIAFQAPENYKPIITEGSEGVNKTFLPVPAVFILDKEGMIQFEYISPDFKHRISNELLVAAAKSLK